MFHPTRADFLSAYCHIISSAKYLCYDKLNKPIRWMTLIPSSVIRLADRLSRVTLFGYSIGAIAPISVKARYEVALRFVN